MAPFFRNLSRGAHFVHMTTIFSNTSLSSNRNTNATSKNAIQIIVSFQDKAFFYFFYEYFQRIYDHSNFNKYL